MFLDLFDGFTGELYFMINNVSLFIYLFIYLFVFYLNLRKIHIKAYYAKYVDTAALRILQSYQGLSCHVYYFKIFVNRNI